MNQLPADQWRAGFELELARLAPGLNADEIRQAALMRSLYYVDRPAAEWPDPSFSADMYVALLDAKNRNKYPPKEQPTTWWQRLLQRLNLRTTT